MNHPKIVTIIGTRPQIIKYFPMQRCLNDAFEEVLINTGQHYDQNMAGVFFDELGIKRPDYDLDVRSGHHGSQTAEMLQKIESVLIAVKPDGVLVFGDTNSTLAGALAAAKMNIPVFHVESGLRSFNKKMPEEQNRILVDHLATLLFCPTSTAVENLENEGIYDNVYLVGDVMFDATRVAAAQARMVSTIIEDLQIKPKSFNLLTLHRAENTKDHQQIQSIMEAIEDAGVLTIFPTHPRTRKFICDSGINIPKCIKMIPPTGYYDILILQENAAKILSDSGGIQKEAYFLGTPCIVLREETEWTELVANGNNVVVGTQRARISEALRNFEGSIETVNDFGNGYTSEEIVNIMLEFYSK